MGLGIAMFSWESMHSIAIGGLAPHVTELAGGLQRRGHDVHVFTRMGLGQSRYEVFDGVHYHRCPFVDHPDFLTQVGRMNDSFVWHFAEAEHFMGRPFDLVHGHDWLSVFALARSKNVHHRTAVMTMHSTEYGRCGNTLWDDPLSRRIRDLEWEGAFIADRVICVSRTLCREVHGQYLTPMDKMFAVYNGVNAKKYDGPVDVAAVRRRYQVGADDPCVLFAGRLTWQKGPDILVEALPSVLLAHPNAKVVFAGDGDMRRGLEARVDSLGIAPATRFLGYRNGGELISLFKSTDVVCVPSRNEPFGIVILEAWSAGKPVVATRIGGPEEFVHNEHNGLKVSADAESIGQGLDTLLANRESSREMGRNGRLAAESQFSWDQSAAETEKVYFSALGRIPAGEPVGAWSFSKEDAHMRRNGDDRGAPTVARKAAPPVLPSLKSNKSAPGPVKSKAVAEVLATNGPTHEQIRQRAYEIFLARGATSGDPVADWLRAERELRETM